MLYAHTVEIVSVEGWIVREHTITAKVIVNKENIAPITTRNNDDSLIPLTKRERENIIPMPYAKPII